MLRKFSWTRLQPISARELVELHRWSTVCGHILARDATMRYTSTRVLRFSFYPTIRLESARVGVLLQLLLKPYSVVLISIVR